ncbi:MAG: ribonuclease Z [Candidatus Diapherotrites archaeon]|nr:ribonuclease Z [Candidatus Diapherotrites archaeon]
MKLTVLGGGSAVSGASRNPSGYVVSHNSESIVLDLGYGCFKQLQKAGFSFTKINNLFFSHLHCDHINDLSAFCFSRFVALQWLRKPAKFNVFGPKGIRKFFNALANIYPQLKDVDAAVREIPNKKIRIGKFTVQSIRVPHTENSIAYSVSAAGKKIVYGGDCSYNSKLAKFAKNADLLILECSLAKETAGQMHLTPQQAGQIAAAASAKQLMLTHFYPSTEKIDCKKKAARFFKGKILLAKDLMRVTV